MVSVAMRSHTAVLWIYLPISVKKVRRRRTAVCLKCQITDFQTAVFISQIKVGFLLGFLLHLSSPGTDKVSHKFNSQQTLWKYDIQS